MPKTPDDETLRSWARCMSEHALFLELGIVADPALSRKAAEERSRWESLRDSGPPSPRWAEAMLGLSADLAALKARVLSRMEGGEWLGWLLPSFVRHMLDELLHFTGLLEAKAGISASGAPLGLSTWLRLIGQDAGEVARQIDPSEERLSREARAIAGGFSSLAGLERGRGAPAAEIAVKAGRDLEGWLASSGLGTPKAKSAVHPVLAAHVAREAELFIAEIGV